MKQIKNISLIFVLFFSMIGLSGCGGPKIVNEYYEFNDWLNENIELKEDGQAGSKYLYTMTNKSEYNLKNLPLALVPEDKADIKSVIKKTKEFKDAPDLIETLGISASAMLIGEDINANTTLTLYSSSKIHVDNCKIICNYTFNSFKDGELKKDGALKDADLFKKTVKELYFASEGTARGTEITITNGGESDLILNDNKVIYKYSITNDGECEATITVSNIISKSTGESLSSLYPLKEGLVRPTSSVNVGAGKTVEQGSDKNISDPIYVSGVLY